MDIPGLPARQAALRLLDAVLRRGETLEQAGVTALSSLRGDSDKSLARALAGETLRWLTDIDHLIDSATPQILPDDAKPRAVLRLMLAGWLRLETPPHVVIATGLPMLAGGPRRLAHGVFGTLTRREATLPAAPSLPAAVAARWGDQAGLIGRGLAVPPPLDLTLKDGGQDSAATAEWGERLGGISLLPGHVRLARGDAVTALAGYDEGQWWVQDLAASIPARLLGPGNDRRVLDVCAAPGGKTLQLAAAGWNVTALDANPRRLQRLQANLDRVGLTAELVRADALTWEPEQPFDAVLLDAPCSATGTCRRHPDVLHRIGAGHIAQLAELQAALLSRAQRWVRPGGDLVYAVCSLEEPEGPRQADAVTWELVPMPADRLPPGLTSDKPGWLRTNPGQLADLGGLDGFFIAHWRNQPD